MGTPDAFADLRLVLRITIQLLLLNIMSTMFVMYPEQQGLFAVLKIPTLQQYNAILELCKTTPSLAIPVSSMESQHQNSVSIVGGASCVEFVLTGGLAILKTLNIVAYFVMKISLFYVTFPK